MIWERDRSLANVTGCELMESIKKRFDMEGIEIPFPYRTILYKKDMHPYAVPKQEAEGPVTDVGASAGTSACRRHFQKNSELSVDSCNSDK